MSFWKARRTSSNQQKAWTSLERGLCESSATKAAFPAGPGAIPELHHRRKGSRKASRSGGWSRADLRAESRPRIRNLRWLMLAPWLLDPSRQVPTAGLELDSKVFAKLGAGGSKTAFMAATKFSSTFCCSPQLVLWPGARGEEQQDSDSRRRDGSRGPRQTT